MQGSPQFLFSLRTKLTIGILLVLVFALWLLSFSLMNTVRRELLTTLVGRGQVIARSVERVIRLEEKAFDAGRQRWDRPILERILLYFAEEEDLQGIGLYDDRTWTQIARQGQAADPRAVTWQELPGGDGWLLETKGAPRLLLRSRITADTSPLVMVVSFSLDGVNQAVALTQIRTILQTAISAALIFTFLTLLLTFMIINPLRSILVGMERVSRGDLDQRLFLHGEDELALLSRAFNEMTARLKENRATIEEQLGSLRTAHAETLETQAKLITAEKMASLGTLAAGMAHEVGNPLGAVMGYLELLKKGGLTPEDAGDCMQRAAAELQRIHEIMLDLLNYARPCQEPAAPLDVNAVIRAAVESLRIVGSLGGLEIELGLAGDLPRPQGFPHKLEQVFVNLMQNAAWATGRAGKLSISTSCAGEAPGACRELRVVFTDNGRGIAPEHLAKLFDPFFTTRPEGTGLGLAISRSIVEEMGGTISAASSPGAGAVFTIRMPIPGPEMGYTAAHEAAMPAASGGR